MPISVSHYSANITDWGATVDEPNNAPIINDMIQSGMTTIRIPDGVFRITETIVIDQEDVVFEGNGTSSVIEMTTADALAFDVNGTSSATRLNGCGFRNLWIRGEDYSGPQVEPTGSAKAVAILARHVNNFFVEGCHISHFGGNALMLEDSRQSRVSDNTFHSNYFNPAWATYSGGSDIYTSNDDDGLTISNNYLLSNNKLGVFVFSIGDATSISISDNVIETRDINGDLVADGSIARSHGIGLFYGPTQNTLNNAGRCVVKGNIVNGTLWNGIYVSADNTSTPDTGGRFAFVGNVVSRTGIDHKTGDDLLQGALVCLGGRELLIDGNLITDYYGYSSTDVGITGYGAINVYQQNEGCDISIVDNIIKNCPTHGIYIGGKACRARVSGNQISGNGSSDDTNKHGIYIDQSSSVAPIRSALTSCTISGGKVSKASHGWLAGYRATVNISTNGLNADTVYYLVDVTTNDFGLALTPGGTAETLSDGGSFTVSHPYEYGGHQITNNYIETWQKAIYYRVDNEIVPAIIEGNTCINRMASSTYAGDGVQILGQKGRVRSNYFNGFNQGVYFSSQQTGRRIEEIQIDDNHFHSCGYAIRVDNDATKNGLVVACNNSFVACGARIYTLSQTCVVEGQRRGNGNIEAWGTAIPDFGTWAQYDLVTNRTWAADVDVVEWVKTDAGTELFSAATFTPRMVGSGTSDVWYNAGTSGISATIDWNNGNRQYLQLTGNCIVNFTNPPTEGELHLYVYQDASGTWTLDPDGGLTIHGTWPQPRTGNGQYTWYPITRLNSVYILDDRVPAWGN